MAARTWLAVILSLGVWFAYERFLAPKPALVPEVVTSSPSPGGTESSPTLKETTGGVPKAFKSGHPTREDFWIKAETMEIAFSDVGGQIATVRLLKYREDVKRESTPITLVSAGISPYSLSTLFSDPELAPFRDAMYTRQVDGNRVIYSATLPSKISLRKEYVIDVPRYRVDTHYILNFPVEPKRELGHLSLPVGAREFQYDNSKPLKSWESVLYQNDSIKRTHVDSINDGEEILQGNTSWLAFGNRYFSTVIRNESKLNPDAVFAKSVDFAGGYLRYPLLLKENERQITLGVSYFLVPKEFDILSSTPGMKRLIDYGMLSFLAFPLLDLLNFLYKYVHNYGIAIILLTFLVRLLFYPLSRISFKSMKEMQKLQPRLQELKTKYSDDRERFQKEQLALFKTHKVNPFGGCLPIMVQIPVFIALYSVLGNSIELYQAPFFGWIHDLSSMDPYLVFPILMGIAMVVQQKITPAVGMDPTQQKIMMAMPIVFTFMMYNLPSGLTIYMFVSTLLGILQQYVITRSPGTVPATPTAVSTLPDKG